ncbi:hypothetical protein OH717_31135 [Streptomyces albidoflavus]|nr:hypothetical protein OH717_31135 [Streptomyces albidoflavus]
MTHSRRGRLPRLPGGGTQQAPGRVVLDLPIPLPRTGASPEELRASADFAALRARVTQEVKAAA